MDVWVWRQDDFKMFLSEEKPQLAAPGDFRHGSKDGNIIGPLGAAVCWIPDGMLQFLPPAGEISQVLFHEQLWGKAQELPSYKKKLWVGLQAMLNQ